MLILLTVSLLTLNALALTLIRLMRPEFKFSWLLAAGGALLAWFSVLLWQVRLPQILEFPAWKPEEIFLDSPVFMADGIAWAYSLALVTMVLASLFTAVVRAGFPQLMAWAGSLGLTALGVLAVVSDNPLTLVLVWAAIDLGELFIQLRSAGSSQLSQSVVTAFAIRAGGGGVLLWASLVSLSGGTRMNFESTPPEAGIYLLAAAGLRLGIFPLRLPFSAESGLRRGFGTSLRLISAASSLILLARVPSSSVLSPLTPFLLALTTVAGLYGGWKWMQANNDLNGRPFWVLGMASLAVASALRGNPAGSAAWGIGLILAGTTIFLTSVQHTWLKRLLLMGALGISAVPFTMTAVGWQSSKPVIWVFWPPLIISNAFLIAGYIRHARHSSKVSFQYQPIWAQNLYPVGIGLPLTMLLLLSLWGWPGALQPGMWLASLATILVTAGLVWLGPRFKVPARAHWVRPSRTSGVEGIYRNLEWLFQVAGSLLRAFSTLLEGDGGILWTLVFLVLFISLFAGGAAVP